MDIAVKLTLIASILFLGYNVSEVFLNYESACEKMETFKRLRSRPGEAPESSLRRSNFLLSFFLSVFFVVLIYFSGIAFWVSLVVAIKLAFTLFCSDMSLMKILHSDVMPRNVFFWTKVDAVSNALIGLALVVIVVN